MLSLDFLNKPATAAASLSTSLDADAESSRTEHPETFILPNVKDVRCIIYRLLALGFVLVSHFAVLHNLRIRFASVTLFAEA